MTYEQKQKIVDLCRAGYGYVKIAQELKLSVNTVKSFCYRNPTDTVKSDSVCRECGTNLVQIQGSRAKKFCSDACRIKWWNKHTELMQSGKTECQHCGKSFHGRKGRKYCSHACYIAERFGGKNVS